MQFYKIALSLFKRRRIAVSAGALLALGLTAYEISDGPQDKTEPEPTGTILLIEEHSLNKEYQEWQLVGRAYRAAWDAHEAAAKFGDPKKERETRLEFETVRNDYFVSTQNTYAVYLAYCMAQPNTGAFSDPTACANNPDAALEGKGSRLMNLQIQLTALQEEIEEAAHTKRHAMVIAPRRQNRVDIRNG